MKSLNLETLAYFLFEIDAKETMTVEELRNHVITAMDRGSKEPTPSALATSVNEFEESVPGAWAKAIK